ncbi:MAG: hypothetical protein ACYTXA_29460 [Nostoc sp.]
MAKSPIHQRLADKVAWTLKPFILRAIRKKTLRETLKQFLGLISFCQASEKGELILRLSSTQLRKLAKHWCIYGGNQVL